MIIVINDLDYYGLALVNSCVVLIKVQSVFIGIDTDTNAAICGGLAGIYYGFDSIPVDWVNEIDRIDEVLSLCERFEEFCDESQ